MTAYAFKRKIGLSLVFTLVLLAATAFIFTPTLSAVGSAAMGAISEKPEIATNALIFIALAEGLVVFGFITALMILGNA